MATSTKKTSAAKSFSNKLADPSYYEAAIDKLHSKFSAGAQHMLYEMQEDGYAFTQVYYDKKKIAKILARDIGKGEYEFSPAVVKEIQIGNKLRKIYSFTLFDRIVHLAVFAMLADDAQKLFPLQVYSYVKGKSRADAVQAFMQFVRKHCEANTIPSRRGLYVYRFDIKSYGESIPVTQSSQLWDELGALFKQIYGALPTAQEQGMLTALIRPQVVGDDGALYENILGITDGASITSLLLNLYVSSIDKYVAGIKGGFYARYGDDILFAHKDRDIFIETVGNIDVKLAGLGLTKNNSKTKLIFYNAAGRAQEGFTGSTAVEYLGMQMHFNGTAALKNEKIVEFMRDMRQRVRITVSQLHGRPLDDMGKMLCQVINNALDPKHPLANKYAVMLLSIVNDRGQLNDVDYRIARLVLQMLTGDSSVKKFRTIPYKKMREEWNLVSLEYNRNR